MIRVNIDDAETHFFEYLEKVAAGETVVVCKGDVAVAEIRPPSPEEPVKSKELRQFGFYKGQFTIPDSFFDPLPDDILDYFGPK